MKIYTYFQPIPQLDLVDETKLVLLWIDKWRAAGFEPEVLNLRHAMTHPLFEEFNRCVSKLPSINPAGYDLACYYRWLAVANCIGEGEHKISALMSDADVMPYGFDPYKHMPEENGGKLAFFQKHVPALVFGTKQAFLDQCHFLMHYQLRPSDVTDNGQPHTSDMVICQNQIIDNPKAFHYLDVMKLYTEAGWETAPAVHYANGTCAPNGKVPRWQHIPNLR